VSRRVAVIDVGSISIKALVAGPDEPDRSLVNVFEATREVRMSTGISGDPPVIAYDRIKAGAKAVASLLKDCEQHGPLEAVRIVATSAIRSAANGHAFVREVENQTGLGLDVLSGNEEAEAIAVGVLTDPAVGNAMRNLTVFDLGGGSLELIRFEDDQMVQRCSLPLGSVRLTERFIRDPRKPFSNEEQGALSRHLEASIVKAFQPLEGPLVGCSGGLTVLRKTLADKAGLSLEEYPAFFSGKDIHALAKTVLGQSIEERVEVTGLPPERADVFPTALLTIQTLLDLTRSDGVLHSLHNLRFGIARKLLHPVP
jgi:exopolyphosphatase/guanosine-5'-triphosphate,3'-diphosphate pyrophosphatase